MRLVKNKTPIKLAIIASLLSITGNSFAEASYSNEAIDKEIKSAYDLLEFQDKMAKQGPENQEELISQSIKLKAMAEYAKTVAIRSGLKSRIAQIHNVIRNNERNLDAIYDFNSLMIQGKVTPPIISEATNLYNQPNSTQINIAKKRYNIEQQARFSSTGVNWREYLQFPIEANVYDKFTYIAGDMKPTNQLELRVWREATLEGWSLGVNQANELLRQSLQRLNRDYIGMVRFHEFVMQGKLSMPVISQYKIHDTNNGTTMVIDEDLLRITVLPMFNSQEPITNLPQLKLDTDEIAIVDENSFVSPPTVIAPIEDEMNSHMDKSQAPSLLKNNSKEVIEVAQEVQNQLNGTSNDGRVESYLEKSGFNQPSITNGSDNSNGSIYASRDKKQTLGIEIKRIAQ